MIRTFGLLLYLNGLFLLLYSHVEIIKKEKKPFFRQNAFIFNDWYGFQEKKCKKKNKNADDKLL